MADKRKPKKKAQEGQVEQAEIQPSKLEYSIAKYMKNKVPTKKTRFLNHQVTYFNSNKAIDILLDSQWATGDDAIFTDRASIVEFGNRLLQHKFFHRAKKIAVTDKDLSAKELKKKQEKAKEKKKEIKNEEEKANSEDGGEKQDSKGEKDKKKKTKIKLDMHLEQVFLDGSEAYVWMYDPIPFWYYIAGAFMLFAAIAVCLFPLWPPIVRKGVYYLSVAAAGFLGVILGLAVLRFIIFIIIWILSLGRHHFWILPNLTEDVGFFASFWPLYKYEYRGSSYDKKKKGKKKKQEEEVDKDNSESKAKKSDADEALDSQSAGETTDKPETDAERHQSEQDYVTEESDSENSNSQTFEMVNKEDVSSYEHTKQE